jgi:hypothetical protein
MRRSSDRRFTLKNEPKTPDAPDALDVGPGEASSSAGGSPEAMRSAAGFHNFGFSDFPTADAQISELGGCCRRILADEAARLLVREYES